MTLAIRNLISRLLHEKILRGDERIRRVVRRGEERRGEERRGEENKKKRIKRRDDEDEDDVEDEDEEERRGEEKREEEKIEEEKIEEEKIEEEKIEEEKIEEEKRDIVSPPLQTKGWAHKKFVKISLSMDFYGIFMPLEYKLILEEASKDAEVRIKIINNCSFSMTSKQRDFQCGHLKMITVKDTERDFQRCLPKRISVQDT